MSAERRLLDVLEAATIDRDPVGAWAERVSSSLTRAVNGGLCATALAFDATTRRLEALTPSDPALDEVMAAGQSSLDGDRHAAVYGDEATAQTASELFAGAMPPPLLGTLRRADAADVLGIACRTDPRGAGVSFAVLLDEPRALAADERRRLLGVGKQLALAHRLRAALERLSHDDDEDDPLRDGIARALRELDRARARARTSKADAEAGAALLERLLSGGWVVVPVEVNEARTRLVAVRTPLAAAAALRRLPVEEREVALLAASGLSNKEIAWQLEVTENTVKDRLRRAQQRLGVRRRATLVRVLGDLA